MDKGGAEDQDNHASGADRLREPSSTLTLKVLDVPITDVTSGKAIQKGRVSYILSNRKQDKEAV